MANPAHDATQSDLIPRKQQMAHRRPQLWSTVGSIFIGVSLPVLLVCWHDPRKLCVVMDFSDQGPLNLFTAIVQLEVIAVIFCGPGAAFLSFLLFRILLQTKLAEPGPLIRAAMLGAAGLAFFNVPGFLAGTFLSGSAPSTLARLVLLFLVAGMTSGVWIGWQVYREKNPGAPLFPRYRLSSLMMLVLAWATLLIVFAPTSPL
jgi:hypothetical protein